MLPWNELDKVPIPGGGSLRLIRRGDEFSIMLGPDVLMNSRLSGSEEALATLACARLDGRANPHILIGGLGMGFTLRAALAKLGATAKITVAELLPAVIVWARGPMAALFDDSLDDPRVRIHEGDVGALLAAGGAKFDAVLLDVDNGPEGLTREGNDALYTATGLRAAFHALRPGGIYAVWSQGPDEAFTRRLRKSGFAVEEHRVRASRSKRGARHLIWIATRPAISSQ